MQLLTQKEIQKKEAEITKGIQNRPNFFSETFAELKRNNMNLALLVSKDVMSDESEPDQRGVLNMILIGLKMLGATNNFDKSYVEVSIEAIAKSKHAIIEVRKDSEKTNDTLIPSEVAEYLKKISPFVMKDTRALPDKVFTRIESYIKLILVAGVTRTMAMPH